MQGTHVSEFVRNARRLTSLTLILASLALSGCLEQEEGDDGGFVEPSGNGNGKPVISGNPAAAVKIGDAYSFSPNASDPDGDSLKFAIGNQPRWADFDTATGKLSGRPTLGDVGIYKDISISVSDDKATSALPRFSISVDQIGTLSTTLSWTPPTENEDGTALVDLAGYKIYWGTTPGNYTHSVALNNPGLTSYVVDNLAAGTYEFVATSINAAGVESAYSSPRTKSLP
jgi:hypothetical protein